MRWIIGRWWLPVALFTLALAPAGCALASSTGPTGQQATATPPPTATPAPKTLYQADWAGHASEWAATPNWKVEKGALVNDGGGQTPITIPYQPAVENYTVNVVMTVTGLYGASDCSNQFGLEGQTNTGQPEYDGLVNCIDKQLHGFANVYAAIKTDTSGQNTYDYSPGVNPRTYTVEARGKNVTFLLNGAELGTVTCPNLTSPSRVLLVDKYVGLRVESVTVTTP